MSQLPNLIHADNLKNWDISAEVKKGSWVAARPLAVPGTPRFFRRIRLAWGVFRGRYDALKWEGQ